MDLLINTFKKTGTFHHAYSVEGDREKTKQNLFNFFEKDVGLAIRGNPDFSYAEYETFTIDDGRALVDKQKNKSFSDESGAKKIFVIVCNTIPHEAQNSLLKVLEEPTQDTHFFFIIPSQRILLPTVRSRMMNIQGSTSNHEAMAAEFLNLNHKKRLEFLEEIIEEKNKQKAVELLQGIQHILRHKKAAHTMTPQDVHLLEEISKSQSYIRDRSPSLKLLLEHIALIV